MIACFACEATFSKNQEFMKHVASVHSHLKFFACTEERCHRKYNALNSFRRHRNTIHCDDEPLKPESLNPATSNIEMSDSEIEVIRE